MKKVTDTYNSLVGEKRYIGSNTEILTDSKIIKDVIADIVKNDNGASIKKISFGTVTPEIEKKAKAQFADADLTADGAYIVEVEKDTIGVYANSNAALLYGACAVHSHYDNGIEEGLLCNIPLCEERAVKVYIPARQHIPYFKEFIDMCMYYGYNRLYMEVGGAMEYKKHPEINEGWVEYAEFCGEYSGKARKITLSQEWNKNSIHWENCGKSFLTQDEMRELVAYCKEREIDVVPEVPTLSHCDYLLTRHREFAENPADPFPDCYCPSNPEVYNLVFDVLEEIIDVFEPKMVHIAHDEWYQVGVCDKCKGKDPARLYADDVWRIYNFLKERNVEAMVWGDKLLDNRQSDGGLTQGGGVHTYRTPTDKTIEINGKEYPIYDEDWEKTAFDGKGGVLFTVPPTWQAIDLVPKDLKIMNWSHRLKTVGYDYTDDAFNTRGMWNVYGNFNYGMLAHKNWFKRIANGVKGFCLSNWSMLEQKHMQRNAVLICVAYGAMMTWDRTFNEDTVLQNLITAAHDLFVYANRRTLRGSHIEITHTTDVIIPHDAFVDGNCIDEDADRLGYYHINYEDGTTEKVSILWGCNIGYCGKENVRPQSSADGANPNVDYIAEPTFTCEFDVDGDRLYYKFVIPTDKVVREVVPEIFDKYADQTTVKSIEIIK